MNIFLIKIVKVCKKKPWIFIAGTLIFWKIYLQLAYLAGQYFLPQKTGYTGISPWSNFDGNHYVSIAKDGYGKYEHAFFPLYPYLIRTFAPIFNYNYYYSALFISLSCMVLLCFVLFYLSKRISSKSSSLYFPYWVIIMLITFPTSFYFASVYTESLFLFLTLMSFFVFYIKVKHWKMFYCITASLASATRFIGAFLLVPIGLILYMISLYKTDSDPLLFFHVQPAFGANRSGGDLILLPQVFWRYLKIFITVPHTSYDFWIALLEISMFILVCILLYIGFRRKLPRQWIYFSFAAIIFPTLTGTLSSIPRYVLVAFPIYFILAGFPHKYKYMYILFSLILLFILTMFFTSGYFIA